MSSLWYRNGTIDVTNATTTVIGTSTFWLTAANKPAAGDIFTADNQVLYEIIQINSDTELVLDRPFEGITAVGLNYAIIRNTSATVNTRLAAQVTDVLNQLGSKITVSTTAPSSGQGNNGDIWIVVNEGV